MHFALSLNITFFKAQKAGTWYFLKNADVYGLRSDFIYIVVLASASKFIEEPLESSLFNTEFCQNW